MKKTSEWTFELYLPFHLKMEERWRDLEIRNEHRIVALVAIVEGRRKMKIIFRLMCKFHSLALFWFITSLPVAKLLDRVRFGSLKLLCMQFYYLEESSAILTSNWWIYKSSVFSTSQLRDLEPFKVRISYVCLQGHAISTLIIIILSYFT